MTEISGRVAVITGGAAGIGRGIAEEFIARGASVVIADIEEAVLTQTASEIGAFGVRTDVSDLASVEALRDATIERFGRVDIVVNNAGVGPWSAVADLTMDDWNWLIDVNLIGVAHGVQAFLPELHRNEHGGHIVNTASAAGLNPVPGLGVYNVTKFGVVALTETLELEERAKDGNVRTTIVVPGLVKTSINSSTRNRPAGVGGALHDNDEIDNDGGIAVDARWMTPRDAGFIVARAVENNDEYAVTHPELWDGVAQRHARIEAAFAKYPIYPSAE